MDEIIESFLKVKESKDDETIRIQKYSALMKYIKEIIRESEELYMISSKVSGYPYVNDENGAMYIFGDEQNAKIFLNNLASDLLEVKKINLDNRAVFFSKLFYKDNILGVNILNNGRGIFIKASELVKEPNIQKTGHDFLDDIIGSVYKYEPSQIITPVISSKVGGDDPLEQISIYESNDYYHFITYGFSNMGVGDSNKSEYSGFGMELTLKLLKSQLKDITWPCELLQSYARYVFESNNYFVVNQFIGTDPNSSDGINPQKDSTITAFITKLDDKFGVYNTPNGKIEFIELVGITQKEFSKVYSDEISKEELIRIINENNPSGITDLYRNSLL